MLRDRTVLPPTVRWTAPTITSLSDHEAWTNFRFRKADLSRLFIQRHSMPEEWVCGKGSRSGGETGLLLLLFRPNKDTQTVGSDLAVLFRRESSQLSRLFGTVVGWVWENRCHRMMNYLPFWAPSLGMFAEKEKVE